MMNLIPLLNPGNMEEAYLGSESIPQLIYSLVHIYLVESLLVTKFNLILESSPETPGY